MDKKARKEQKMIENRKSGKFKKLNLITGVLLGMFLTVSVYLIYNLYKLTGVETIIRYIVMGLLGFFDLFLIIKYLKMVRRPLLKKYIIFLLLIIIFGCGEYFVGLTIHKGLTAVDKMSVKKFKTYKTSIVALKDGKLTDVKDITSETKIGRITDKSDIEGYKLTKYLISKDNIDESQIEDYDDSITMLYDLYEGKIEAVFISANYDKLYSSVDKFENIKNETIVLDTYKKKMRIKKDDSLKASTKSSTEPFTLLLMGVDSDEEVLTDSSGLGDSLMLITFNPKTLNATILSIPRDTYVPITCYRNANSKITHAASGGDKCMINTIQNAFDVNIDYYAKINFRGLMKLVDALDGIDVDVPYAFCETTMWRTETQMVYVEKGMQHLNGEQALALSRNRKTYKRCGPKYNSGTRDDFVRGQNQQLVINAIMNKAKNIRSISQFYNLLDAVGSSLATNMDRKQILSFYNVFKNVLLNSKDLTDENSIINMQKMYLNGSGGLYPDGIMSMDLYEYIPSTQSMNAIKNAMKINLGLKEEKVAKTFSFSADKEYQQKVIGKDLSGGVNIPKSSSSSSDTSNSCGTNEEFGADGVTCVCKWGYTRNSSGVCSKEEEKETKKCTGAYEMAEPLSDGTCGCMSGYHREDGACVVDSSGDEDENDDTQSDPQTGGGTGGANPNGPDEGNNNP